jgi:hypothetical protein
MTYVHWDFHWAQICPMVPLEPSIGGRSVEKSFYQSVVVVVEPMAVGDVVVPYFLFDGKGV